MSDLETKPKILIVDDEVDIAELLAEYLEGSFTVAMANSVKEACDKIGQNSFDLIVTDLHLPDCGPQSSVSHYRKLNFSGQILLITGQDEFDASVKKAMDDGAQGLIKKPFTLDAVEASITKCIRGNASKKTAA